MFIEDGYVLLARKLLKSPLLRDMTPEQFKVAIVCLLRANYEDREWMKGHKKILIKRGQFVIEQRGFAKYCGVTLKILRVALAKLKLLGFLQKRAQEGAQGYTIITICNYTKYQNPNNYEGHKEGHVEGTLRAQTKEYKNNKNNIYTCDFFSVDSDFHQKLKEAYPDINLLAEFKKMNVWLETNPQKRPKKNIKRFINNWLARSNGKTQVTIDPYQGALKRIQRELTI